MRQLTREEVLSARMTVEGVLARNQVENWDKDVLNPFLFEITVPASVGKVKAVKIFNDMFHELGILQNGMRIRVGEVSDYCAICADENGKSFSAEFNHPVALNFNECDEEYRFTIRAMFPRQGAECEGEVMEKSSEVTERLQKRKSSTQKSRQK